MRENDVMVLYFVGHFLPLRILTYILIVSLERHWHTVIKQKQLKQVNVEMREKIIFFKNKFYCSGTA
jgi:hypothetical protein